MTPRERELLSAFLQQMTLAQAGQKDAEAEARMPWMIRRTTPTPQAGILMRGIRPE